MQERGGYIKLYRSLLEWEWYDDPNTLRVFLHILLNANWKESKWRGETIKEGEFCTTIAELSKILKLSNQQTRTALEHLKSTNEITIKTSPKSSIISIKNWDRYQDINKRNNNQTTNHRFKNQQTNNKRSTNAFHYKEEYKEGKNKEERESGCAAPPSLLEVEEYCADKGYRFKPEVFVNYYAGIGWRWNGQPITDWKRFADKWNAREEKWNAVEREKKPKSDEPHSSFDIDDLSGLGMLDD